jgi:hypothetical protein
MTRDDRETVRVTKELVANDEAVAQGFYRVSHLTSQELEIFYKDRMHYDSQTQIRTEDRSDGLIEGEKKKSMEIARKLHLLGLSAQQISDITGCSILEIKKSDQN